MASASRQAGDDAEPRIELRCGERVADPRARLGQGFDAVLVSVGTHDGTVLPMPGHDLDGVLRNTDFLKAARQGTAPDLTGLRVMVLGGGNVAYDCARTAVRLGAESVDIALSMAFWIFALVASGVMPM